MMVVLIPTINSTTNFKLDGLLILILIDKGEFGSQGVKGCVDSTRENFILLPV